MMREVGEGLSVGARGREMGGVVRQISDAFEALAEKLRIAATHADARQGGRESYWSLV